MSDFNLGDHVILHQNFSMSASVHGIIVSSCRRRMNIGVRITDDNGNSKICMTNPEYIESLENVIAAIDDLVGL